MLAFIKIIPNPLVGLNIDIYISGNNSWREARTRHTADWDAKRAPCLHQPLTYFAMRLCDGPPASEYSPAFVSPLPFILFSLGNAKSPSISVSFAEDRLPLEVRIEAKSSLFALLVYFVHVRKRY